MKNLNLAALTGNVEHERLASLINSMADGVIAVDQHMKVALYNGAALDILDTNGSMTGKALGNVFHPLTSRDELVDIHEIVTATKTAHSNRSWSLHYDDGSTVRLYTNIAPVRLSYGRKGSKGYVILLRNITHEKSLEDERNEFISVVSHELRTPIATAEGTVGNAMFIAAKSNAPELVLQALKAAHEQILYLSEMINDLSTLSRAERGKLNLDVTSINVHELLQELVLTYEPLATAKNLTLRQHSDLGLELLHSSQLYVREILQNFVTNAIKYTDSGSVTISAKQLSTGVAFAIEDTGIGISKADQEKIFDKFFRSEDYRTRANTGTGLGLYITEKLLHLIQANVTVSSRLNHGSTFTVTIPDLAKVSN